MTVDPDQLRAEIEADQLRLRRLLEEDLRADYGRLAVVGGPGAFAAFMRWAWPIVEPGAALEWNWHHDLVCEEVQDFLEGKVRALVINMPPGYMKSLIVSVMAPAYAFLRDPADRAMFVSGSGDANKRDSRKCRDILMDDGYQELAQQAAELEGRKKWGLKSDQQEKLDYSTTEQGHRKARPLGGKITSMRGRWWCVDDPHDVADATIGSPEQIAKRMEEAGDRIFKVLTSRLNSQKKGGRMLMMQRVHVNDAAGQFIRRVPGCRVVCLPVEYDPDHPNAHPKDPRTKAGELLFPEREGPEELAVLREALGEEQYAAQYNQAPYSTEGGLFRKSHFSKLYSGRPRRELGSLIAMTCDLSFKGGKSNDYVALGVVALDGVKRRPLDVVMEHVDFYDCLGLMRELEKQWRPDLILVEDKANGPATVSTLQRELHGVVAFNPDKYGSKYARAQILKLAMAGGQWEFPDDFLAPWLAVPRGQCLGFPHTKFDDGVDMWSQLEIYAREELGDTEMAFG